jgi:hypothetical protein
MLELIERRLEDEDEERQYLWARDQYSAPSPVAAPAEALPPAPAVAPASPPAPASAPAEAEFLDAREAADLLGTTVKGLEGLRRRGTGPAYIQLGKRIRYRRADLLRTVQETVQGKPSKP